MPEWSSPSPATMIVCTVHPGEPQSKERPRRGPAGNFYTPTATKEAEEALKWTLKLAKKGGADDVHTFAVWAIFYVGSKRRVDGDNFLKLLLDAGNGIVWKDDAQVTEMHAKVVRKDKNPRTEILVCTLGVLP